MADTVSPPPLDLSTLERASNRAVLLRSVAFAGKDVVDIGCGDSRLARLIADHGGARTVTGIECSPRQRAKADSLPPHPQVQVIDGVAQSLPLADASVDVAVFFNSLHHVPASAMATGLAEACRVLRPGGVIYVCEPVAAGAFFTVCQPVDDETLVRKQAQAALAAACHPDSGRCLHRESELFYLHRLELPSFEAFRERIVSANSEREATFDSQDQALRDLFEGMAERTESGAYAFDQPGHMTLLQKSASS
jgi:ubiquinone/menaquinone biosynthesis C-methylase UbiE